MWHLFTKRPVGCITSQSVPEVRGSRITASVFFLLWLISSRHIYSIPNRAAGFKD